MKKIIVGVLALAALAVMLSACSQGETRGKSAYEIAVDNGFEGTEQEWLDELKGTDGKDGTNGMDGTNGVSGADGKDAPVSVQELYDASGFPGTLEEFVAGKMTLTMPVRGENTAVIKNLFSSVSVTADDETVGSGIIYKMDAEGNAYILTEYDVVCDEQPAEDIKIYLYGSESAEQAISAKYACGSATYDIALLSVQNSEILKGSNARAVTFADSNEVSVGQDAYAIGNLNGWINVTSGVVSTDSEIVTLVNTITGDSEIFRAVCMDCLTGSYSGGGGLFDREGKMIGLISGTLSLSDSVGVGYAFPSNVVRFVADNLLYHYEKNNGKLVKKCVLGISLSESDSKAYFSEQTGKAAVVSRVAVTDGGVEGALAYGKILTGDVFKKAYVERQGQEGKEEYEITRSFIITDLMLTLRAGDKLTLVMERETEGEKTDVEAVFDVTEETMKECE